MGIFVRFGCRTYDEEPVYRFTDFPGTPEAIEDVSEKMREHYAAMRYTKKVKPEEPENGPGHAPGPQTPSPRKKSVERAVKCAQRRKEKADAQHQEGTNLADGT